MTRFPRWLMAVVTSGVLLVGCSSGPPAQDGPSTDASIAPHGSASADGGPTPLVAELEALPAGTYVLDLEAVLNGQFPTLTVTVPDGWGNIGGWSVIRGGKGDDIQLGISFWNVDEVFKQPCSGSTLIQPGPTVADLARALGRQPMRDATEPVDIVVDGFKGVQLEWSVPADIDFTKKCLDGDFDSWTAVSGSWNGSRYQQGPGQVDRLWILDIDGERLVVDAGFMPSADAKDRGELWQVMESIRFET